MGWIPNKYKELLRRSAPIVLVVEIVNMETGCSFMVIGWAWRDREREAEGGRPRARSPTRP
eukprot:10197438-Heterocapsa_arctica.AAC.1